MDNTITLSQLITRLAAVTGVDNNTARKFMRALFSTIEDNLAAGHSVTLKNIGTFRPVKGNLSTDEMVVAFTPDKKISSELNKPFEMFSAVELADGVEFESSQDIVSQDQTTADGAEDQATEEEEVPEGIYNETPKEEVIESKQIVPSLRWPEEEEVETTEKESRVEDAVDSDEESITEAEGEQPRRNYLWLWIALIFIAIIGCAYFAAVYTTPVDPIQTEDSEEAEHDTILNEIVKIPLEQISPIEQESGTTSVESKVKPEAKEPVYDTVEVSLIRLAKKHYGESSYWVYIYEANSNVISNPNRIAPGQRVVIPDVSTFPGSSKKETIEIAKAKQKELLSKFK